MATQKKTKQVEKLEVVTDNLEDEVKKVSTSSETVTIACHLAHGLRFDDVPNGTGGTKVVEFPGVNDKLRGETTGVLLGVGKSVAVTIAKKDWEAIKAMHGREAAFVGVDGNLPCLIEMKDVKEFKSRQDEVKEMKHGLEPVEPASAQVAPAKAE